MAFLLELLIVEEAFGMRASWRIIWLGYGTEASLRPVAFL
jgi:hypothetical protein